MTGPAPAAVCAVIPAAGRGTRLGLPGPKILVEVADGLTIWDVLSARLGPVTQHRHVVVSPEAEPMVRARVGPGATVSVQPQPRGMGEAIFGAARYWSNYDAILVTWGDQAHVAAATVCRVADALRAPGPPRVVLPLVRVEAPYVQYDFAGPALARVRMSREGDACDPEGLSDVGVFGLSTRGLEAAWWDYVTDPDVGASTGELNLLPFLPFLSRRRGWPVEVVEVRDPDEARGVNTPEDLAYARRVAATWPR